ncbi:MAG: TetR/AcrR family transcriptional regulator [Pseudomonadota bacterium]|nr:TetR/AcrR family transcriptional regulator [Pseudomonadota bacterium]
MRKRKSAADRKAEIVDTVIYLSARMGPDRVTTQHLADAVGVTQPAIFRHFGTKAEIWDAVSARIVADVESIAHGAGSSVEGLRTYISRYVELVMSRPALPTILHSLELLSENTALRERFYAMHESRMGFITEILEQGQQSRNIRESLDTNQLSNVVLSSLHGLTLEWTLKGQDFDLEARASDLADTLVNMIKA